MLVGVVGFIGSGKSTAGDILETHHGYERDSFAEPLKDITSILFDWPRHLLEGNTEESREFREGVDTKWSDMLEYEVTPRYILQYLGTEVFRDMLHPDIWLYSLKNRYDKRNNPKTVITDVRFPNEMNFIRSQGGKILWVNRGSFPSWYLTVRKGETLEEVINYMDFYYPNVHSSEWRWIRGLSNTDYVIENDGDVNKLKNSINEFMKMVKGE